MLLAQALADWTFTFPALIVPFFLLAGIGLGDDGRPRIAARLATRSALALAVAAVIVLVPPWLSAKLVRSSLSGGKNNGLAWAHRLDPVSVEPLIAEAQLASNARTATSPLEAARARAPRSLAVRYLLGSVYWNAGRRADALREFEAALRLHPGDPAVERALAVVRGASS
jgi:tetratricopeptide (TPR) repeat protein